MSTLLSVKNITQIFSSRPFFGKPTEFRALDNISFDLDEGEILGILGPNGAGKTTTIQILLGLLTPTSGTIEYFGKNFNLNRAEILKYVTYLSPYLKLPGSLTVEENLTVNGMIYTMPTDVRNKMIEQNLKFFGIWHLKNALVRTLSAGQLTRLMLAKVFLSNPKIVLLDEPTAALDPDIADQVRKFILAERKQLGISIILTSHNMAEVEEVCDRVLVLKNGQILASETPQHLAEMVTIAKLHLLVTDIEKTTRFIQNKELNYFVDGQFIEIHLHEQKIPDLLSDIVRADIKYTEISIEKPTLEDYFLSISKDNV